MSDKTAQKATRDKVARAATVATSKVATWTESSFREVYSKYIKPVHAYLLRRVRNHHDAEDLTAQVFSQALAHLDPKDADSPKVAAWLFTSARNASVNHARNRKARKVVSIDEVAEQSYESDFGRDVSDLDDLARLISAIGRLPGDRRKAMVLRFIDELSHAEIGQALGRSEASTRVLVHRTLADLRKEVS